jgi:hypothetical protein
MPLAPTSTRPRFGGRNKPQAFKFVNRAKIARLLNRKKKNTPAQFAGQIH